MDNRFFSLIIVPDSGNEVKSGSFNFKLVFTVFSVLIATFIICLFFIVGFHIKLSQENEYKSAKSSMNQMLDSIDSSKVQLFTLSDQLLKIQRNDIAYRKYAYMDVLDAEMYNAGIGGHVLVDDMVFIGLNNDTQNELKRISLDLVTLDSRINVQEQSFQDIDEKNVKNREESANTPSILPTHTFRITSYYGYRTDPITKEPHKFHDGIDFGGKLGYDIFSAADGVVTSVKYNRYLGNNIVIKHKYGYQTTYGHLKSFNVELGQEVKKGDVIGAMGNTGNSTGVHLHYKITQFGKSVNPIKYF